jgi:hypothetical protein
MDDTSILNLLASGDKPLTLADISITWPALGEALGEDQELTPRNSRTISGQDLAVLLKRTWFFGELDEPGLWACRLRGLSALVYPDAGIPRDEADGRALLSDLMRFAALAVEAEMIDAAKLASLFRITVQAKTPAPEGDAA